MTTARAERIDRRPPAGGVAQDRWVIPLALLATYLIWGSTYLAIRVAVAGIPPFLMTGVRFVVAGGALYALVRLRGAAAPTAPEWLGAALVGGLLMLGGMGGTAVAEHLGLSSGLTAMGVATMPPWTALFSGLWGRWPRPGEWAGLALGVVGVGLVALEGSLQATPAAVVVVLVAAVCWAFGSVWSRRLSLPSGLTATAAEMLAGGALLLAASLAAGERIGGAPAAPALWALAYLIVFGSLLAFSAYMLLLGRVRPALATSYAFVNPVVAVALGIGFAGERLTWIGVLALGVILCAVWLVSRGGD